MAKQDILVFTDGSCGNNGKLNAKGGIGIHFPTKELKDISKVYRLGVCTNQKTELYAILTALRYIKKNLSINDYEITIKTDSEYSINCVTKWVNGWIKNGWITKSGNPVANMDLIKSINKYYTKYDVTLTHVDAHTNLTDSDSVGNAKADKLATSATRRATKETSTDPVSKTKNYGSKTNNYSSKPNNYNTKSTNYNTKPTNYSSKTTSCIKKKFPSERSSSLSDDIVKIPTRKYARKTNADDIIVELVKRK